MSNDFTFSSESVGEGHPDKVADYISDSILDACLEQDPYSRVACETLVKNNFVYLAGEITTEAIIDYESVVRQAIREIGYTHDDDIFHADKIFITNLITKQSPEIANAIDPNIQKNKVTSNLGAGDQGIMFGYATRDTEEYMPAPITFAHRIARELARLRKESVEWLRPDCKTQVAVHYRDGKPIEIANVILSTQHTKDIDEGHVQEFCIENVIRKVIPKELISSKTKYYINPSGRFVIGGPQADAGLTGRKIIVDTYGGWARHGGGAFSGKDPTKVDRSAAYMARWVAKNIVAAGLTSQVEIEIAYAIGRSDPTSIFLSTHGKGKYSDEDILDYVKKNLSFKPGDIINQFGLLQPIYRQTTNYGHFTKQNLPWEQLKPFKPSNLKSST